MERTRRLVVSAAAGRRRAEARAFLAAHRGDALVVGATRQAADDLARAALREVGAALGWVRTTLDRLAADAALAALAASGRSPTSRMGEVALAARVAHLLSIEGRLERLAEISTRPGFPRALARTIAELRMADVDRAGLLGRGGVSADLAALAERYEAELGALGLADRAAIYREAAKALRSARGSRPLALLLLDVPITTALEADLVSALASSAATVLATVPAGDERATALLASALEATPEHEVPLEAPEAALGRLRRALFSEGDAAPGRLDASVSVASWPGKARECVEIARAIAARAADGVAFDRMAVLLHAPGEYAVPLEEALARASIPAHFARGSRRPHPAGRALLALLACAVEGLSARRFAEYLSLAQSPGVALRPDAFAPPSDELTPSGLARVAEARTNESWREAVPESDPTLESPERAAALAGSLPAPWRWERLLTDAAVIGGHERWERRIEGLDRELALQLADLEPDDPRKAAIERRRADLASLASFALPLVSRLAGLPREAPWGEWTRALGELARAALAEPEPVLSLLAELAPAAPVGPIGLDELWIVLAPGLRELATPPRGPRYGAVFVGPPDAARGLSFDTVFVPGLAERTFPARLVEDPLLPDALRLALGHERLATQADAVARERLSLRIAVGAASSRVHLSYPRVDVEQARPRVPSFYLLEVLRAVEGRLEGFEALAERSRPAPHVRLGWPAPERPEEAIDEAEYDLALLGPLLGAESGSRREGAAGAARYLLSANPHLARALRARARRWLRAWTQADGLVHPDEAARTALARHRMGARSFSPTALQNFAACPYRFFLQAIQRLAPREEAAPLETLDPLTRGALFHDAQFEILTALRDRSMLPVRPERLPEALDAADEAIDRVVEEARDRLAPAIPRVWDDAVASVRADLREWLSREAEGTGEWVPYRFELSFGITDRDRRHADPASTPDPVPTGIGLLLRGSIDLVERRADGRLRVTDHKTGKARTPRGVVVGGGEVLQPVLYALGAAALLDAPVAAGRLYYCTAAGDYEERLVPLDEGARRAAAGVVGAVGRALEKGFLPAAPRPGACRYCDYRPICGPYEELRVRRKPADRLAELERVRRLP